MVCWLGGVGDGAQSEDYSVTPHDAVFIGIMLMLLIMFHVDTIVHEDHPLGSYLIIRISETYGHSSN